MQRVLLAHLDIDKPVQGPESQLPRPRRAQTISRVAMTRFRTRYNSVRTLTDHVLIGMGVHNVAGLEDVINPGGTAHIQVLVFLFLGSLLLDAADDISDIGAIITGVGSRTLSFILPAPTNGRGFALE